ncbi:uncharacterized protein LOC127789727 [Diospyros lotus]|uniref:uncharacterized protein LOC127789727 n=1 Tax=Diospyros lotus TaxID=55363 RepID=UPI002253F2EE|nr:uncharacterized protein LOC127789727 [Diospyros lotus]
METNGNIGFRHRQSPSSDRFLDVFSPPTSEFAAGDELNEAEVFWTGDFADPNRRTVGDGSNQKSQRQSFRRPGNSGILAALAEDSGKADHPLIYRKPSATSYPRLLPAIPKPPVEREYSQSVPSRKLLQSAPVSVPVAASKIRKAELPEVDFDDDDDDDDEMLPPHEIVARGSTNSPKTTFSVLEGVGRTLKGRDLRQVRNAVWRKTGFLD